jgi:hypothetical protein
VRLVAELALTVAAQLLPLAQLCTMAPLWSTMSRYHTVGPTSLLVVAVRVTLVFTATEVALALRPVRQVPSLAQALPGVLVAVAPGGGVFVAVGRGVLVAVAPPVQLTVTLAECGPPPVMLEGEVLR